MATAKKSTVPSTPSATPQAVPVAAPVPVVASPAPAPKKTAAKKARAVPVSAKKPAAETSLSKAFAPARPVKVAKPVKQAKPAAKTEKPVKVEKVEKVEKIEKPKKAKLVRDSFTIPKAEYLVLDELKERATRLTRPSKKSELLRAGIKALAAMGDAAFLKALEAVPAIKTGRPLLDA